MSKEIREQKHEDITKSLRDKEGALRQFRFNIAGSKTRNVREGRDLRHEIARLKTELSRRASETLRHAQDA